MKSVILELLQPDMAIFHLPSQGDIYKCIYMFFMKSINEISKKTVMDLLTPEVNKNIKFSEKHYLIFALILHPSISKESRDRERIFFQKLQKKNVPFNWNKSGSFHTTISNISIHGAPKTNKMIEKVRMHAKS